MAATDYTQVVQQLYISYFGRPADPTGLTNFTAQLLAADPAPGTDAALTTTAALSAYSQAHPTSAVGLLVGSFANKVTPPGNDHLSILKFVNDVYNNIFHRDADEGGNFWINAIETGSVSRENAALAITQGAMSNTSTQGMADAALVANVNAVSQDFTSSLDTIAKVISFSGDAAAAASHALLAQVTATTDLTAFHANVVSAITGLNVPVVVNTTLTTGIDTGAAFVGGAGNDVFNGVGTATLNAFNALDSIDGGAGNNTLNVVSAVATSLANGSVTVKNIQTANITEASTLTLDTTNWTGLTSLNVSSSTGAGAVTAAATTAITDTNILATAAAAGAALNSSVDGGGVVNVTVTGTNAAGSAVIGNIAVGSTTAAAGALTVNATETAAVAGTLGNVSARGAAAVTVNSVENVAIVNLSTAGTVSATGAAGVVTVNATTNITETDNPLTAVGAFTTGVISATGGTSIVVNSVVTASAAALAAEIGAGHTLVVTQGGVAVQDGGTATSVTVNQAAPATAAAGTAASLATAATPAIAGIGYDAQLAAAGTAASALTPATLGVVAGVVTVSGTTGIGAGNASNSIANVTIANYKGGAGADYINSNALKSVTLSGSGTGGLTIYNQGGTSFTSLNLNLNKFSDTTGVAINGNGVTTMNVTTGGTGGSTLGAITDTSLTTLNVAGSQTLKLTVVPTSLTAINVSGAAGFNDNGSLSSLTASGTGLAFKTTSSGKITATLHANGLDTFTGSTGQDVITITADQSKAIVGGSGATDELILAGTAATFLGGATTTAAKVSGFETVGINNAGANGNYNMSLLQTGNAFNAIDVISGTGTTATFSNVAKNTSIAFQSTVATANAFVYQSADAQSVTGNDAVTVTLGNSTGGVVTLGTGADTGVSAATVSLLMEDTNQVGIATLNIVSNSTAAQAGSSVNTITALGDSGLSTLNVSGATGLTIGVLNEGVTAGASATAATSFTLNNTSGGDVTISAFTDSALGTLKFTGSGNGIITSLAGVTGQILSISNTGTGAATIGTGFADANLKSLTLAGNVALGADVGAAGIATTQEVASFGTSGFTLAAGTDHAHININATGAVAGFTDTLTVGNGNNYITDGSIAGKVNVTVGTGSNLIDLTAGGGTFTAGAGPAQTANNTYAATVALGAHTSTAGVGIDVIKVGMANGVVGGVTTAWTFTGTAAANTVISGVTAGDKVVFAADAAPSVLVTLSAAHQTAITSAADLATAVGLAFADINVDTGHAAHAVMSFVYGGNTYVIENAAADATLNAGDSIIELVGVHTIAAAASVAGASTISIVS